MMRVYQRATRWYLDLRGVRGERRRLVGYVSRVATEELGRKIEALVEIRASGAAMPIEMRRWIAGLTDGRRATLSKIGALSVTELALTRPLDALIDDFAGSLGAREKSALYCETLPRMAKRLFTGIGAGRWHEIRAAAVEEWLARQRKGGWSAVTSNRYLQAARQFCRWMVMHGFGTEDPLRILKKLPEPKSDRDALEDEETKALLAATAAGKRRARMGGPERALLYRLAVETGLRLGEIRSLRVQSFSLGMSPTVTVEVGSSKRRRRDVLPLRADTAADLGVHLAGRTPKAKAFSFGRHWRAAETVRRDLKDAGVQTEDRDFHCFRHTFVTRLERARVTPKLMQTLARHSTPALTLGVYTHLAADEEARAVGALPSLGPATKEPRAVAVGAEDALCQICATDSGSPRMSTDVHGLKPPASPLLDGSHSSMRGDTFAFAEVRGVHKRGDGGIGRRIGLKIRRAAGRNARDVQTIDAPPSRSCAGSGAIGLAEVARAWPSLSAGQRARIVAIVGEVRRG